MAYAKNNATIEILSGGFSGATSVLFTHCFDTWTVRLQTLPSAESNTKLFQTTINCFKHIVKNEGFSAFYKGIQVPLAGAVPSYAFNFLTYDLGKIMQTPALENGQYSYSQIFIAGAFSGTICVLPTVPMENIKCLLQIDTKNKYRGMFDCAQKLYKSQGLRGIFKGSWLGVCRDAPAIGLHFLIYEYIKNLLTDKDDSLNLFAILCAGGVANTVHWIYAMPIDTLKTFYQTDEKYKSMLHAYRDLTRYEGHRALFRGILPVIASTFPDGAASFLGYELACYVLNHFYAKI